MEINKLKFFLNDLATDLTLYTQLYGEQDSVEVLNKFNGLVFARIQGCMLDRIFGGFARLMDPEGPKGNNNLSLEYLLNKSDIRDDSELINSLENIKQKYQSTNIKKYRNKVLSHNDLKTSLGRIHVSTNITPDKAHELLSDMMSFVNLIEYKLGNVEHRIASDSYIIMPRDKDGVSFIYDLKKHL